MRYKVGDLVKLRDDLDLYTNYGDGWQCNSNMLELKGQKVTITTVGANYYDIAEDDGHWGWTDNMIEGLWEECKPKYKLIDILNKIANGELEEGSKVKLHTGLIKGENNKTIELVYDSNNLYTKEDKIIFDIMNLNILEDEVELIEPECFPHVGKTSEPTDNAKIEELKQLDMDFAEIDFASHEEYARCSIQVLAREMIKQIDKLNEVIRYIKKERENDN